LHGSVCDIPLPDASVDGLYNLGVLEHFDGSSIRKILEESRRVVRPGGKTIIFWPHKNATSVAVLKLVHWFRRRILKKEDALHAPEISLLPSRKHALNILREAGFEPIDYYFGISDFWVQAVVVGQKPSPQTASHHEDRFASHDFASDRTVAIQ
jgi:ubiquinone/menaquinone biosynthesis C-methylase UbiE